MQFLAFQIQQPDRAEVFVAAKKNSAPSERVTSPAAVRVNSIAPKSFVSFHSPPHPAAWTELAPSDRTQLPELSQTVSMKHQVNFMV
jgi:hypothetical protein